MKWLIAVLFFLLLCQGFFSAWTDLALYDQQDTAAVHRGQMHVRIDTLEAVPDLGAYVGDLCVRVDRLEALAGIGGGDE